MRAARARLTRSPSTVPIRTRELVMADRRALRRLEGDENEDPDPPPPNEAAAAALWRAQRKDPGCVVGEHMQVRRGCGWPCGAVWAEEGMGRPPVEIWWCWCWWWCRWGWGWWWEWWLWW